MSIDPRLRQLMNPSSERTTDRFIESVGARPTGLEAAGVFEVDLSVTGVGDKDTFRADLQNAGMNVHSLIEGPVHVATGTTTTDSIFAIGGIKGVIRVSAARDIGQDLDISCPIVRADVAHGRPVPVRGKGVLVGIIDSGIDWQHPDFRIGNQSRIFSLWDQTAAAGAGVAYGAEYDQNTLSAALAAANPSLQILHRDTQGHGTHVSSIAAGHHASFTGMAPEAELVVVKLRSGGLRGPAPAGAGAFGRSTDALDAFDYIRNVAAKAGKPVAINFSQGTNGGGHSGESPLERGVDNLAEMAGVVVVKSAGNEQELRIHASGQLQPNAIETRTIDCTNGIYQMGIVEVWYDGADDISVAIEAPGAPLSAFVGALSAPSTFSFAVVNTVTIDHDVDVDGTGDNVFTLFFVATGGALLPGRWRLHVRGGAAIVNGRFDAWIERASRSAPSQQLRFAPGEEDPTMTISIPGNARRVVTVASSVSNPQPPGSALVGQISTFSSRGPTRYGLQKPDLTAPGDWITAARAHPAGRSPQVLDRGTSMAAPHVTGAASLLLSQHPTLTGDEVRQLLRHSASPLPQSPDPASGAGILDVEAALQLAATAAFPKISNVVVAGTVLSFDTDIATTATLEYGVHLRRLLLGRLGGSLTDMTLATSHKFDLATLAGGNYLVVIVAFSAIGLRTREENGGRCWSVFVP